MTVDSEIMVQTWGPYVHNTDTALLMKQSTHFYKLRLALSKICYREAGLFGTVYKTCCELTAEWLSGTVRIIRDLIQLPNLKLKSLFMSVIHHATHIMSGKLSKISSCAPSSLAPDIILRWAWITASHQIRRKSSNMINEKNPQTLTKVTFASP